MSAEAEINPLLQAGALPRFDLFKTEQVVPSIRKISRRHERGMEAAKSAFQGFQWTSPLGDQVVDGDESVPALAGSEQPVMRSEPDR